MDNFDKILIFDYGSQYTQLIARRIRELNVYSEICRHDISLDRLKAKSPKAIILSGGPMSVYDKNAYKLNSNIFDLDIPILGICYGMQLLMHHFGAKVSSSDIREYGHMKIKSRDTSNLFKEVQEETSVWMSHGDKISSFDDKWDVLALSENDILAAVKYKTENYYGVQFHPEVIHTPEGNKILSNFLFNVSDCIPSWTSKQFIEKTIKSIQNEVLDKKVICGISGGVDSSVMGALINKAIGDQAKFIFVDQKWNSDLLPSLSPFCRKHP